VKSLSLPALLLCLVGCKGAAKPKGPTPEEERKSLEATIAAVDALVPADLRAKIHFEAVLGEKEAAAYLAPAGWPKAFMPGEVKPPEDAGLGFMTSFAVGTNCDGFCEAKEWAPVVDKVEFAQFVRDTFKIEKDEKGTNERTLIAKSDDQTHVRYARWQAGERRYFHCRATLAKEVAAAAPAFEAACKAMKPLDW